MRDGDSIGPYRVISKLGEGGMGAVFLGEHTLLGRRAAIKVLLPELSSKRESVDRFFNEARAATVISDPGIVQVFDFGVTAEKVAYIVMELLEGEALDRRLHRLGVLSPSDALRITRQIAGSLGAAHAAGIIHRDLKPENLYMIRDPEAPGGERPKILDFGIAKLGDSVPDRIRTRTGAVLGTPVYMSPEQCDGAGRIDHRADIYSLGCVLFHLLTGRPPFDLPGIGAIISAHLREPPPPPGSLVAQLPPGLDELVLCCLAKSPDDRFATMAELQQACDAALARITAGGALMLAMPSGQMPVVLPNASTQRSPGKTTTLGTSAGQPSTVTPRRRTALWIVIAALAGGAGGLIALLTSRSGAHPTPAATPAPSALVMPGVPEAVGALDAAIAPVVAEPSPTSPRGPTAATDTTPTLPAATVIDAGAGSASPELSGAQPPARPRPGAATSRPGVAKPPGKARPTKPKAEDLYDDRN